MKNVIVMNRPKAREYAHEPHSEISIVISINDTNMEPNDIPHCKYRNHIAAVLPVFFDDIEEGKGVITISEARDIVNFVNRWQSHVDIIIVHCNAGISRSAGCAAAILKYFTGSDMQIFGNGFYKPNMKVYTTVLEEFHKAENNL